MSHEELVLKPTRLKASRIDFGNQSQKVEANCWWAIWIDILPNLSQRLCVRRRCQDLPAGRGKIRSSQTCLRWTPHPVIVTIGDNRDYIRVLLYSYYTTITGWGVHPKHVAQNPTITYEGNWPAFDLLVLITYHSLGFRGLGFRAIIC